MTTIIFYYSAIFKFLIFCACVPMLYKYFKLLVFYSFSTPIENWIKEIEKARLFVFFFGILCSIVSLELMKAIEPSNLEVPISVFGLIFSVFTLGVFCFIWTNKFENKFIEKIKRRLGKGLKSSFYNQKTELNEILKKLPEFDCDNDTFKNLLLGNRIFDKNKITSSFYKSDIIRFVIIVFSLNNNNTSHKQIKEIISHYFIEEKTGEKYNLQDKASEISGIYREQLNELDKFTSMQNRIESLFLGS